MTERWMVPTVVLSAAALLMIVGANLLPYGGRPSALLNIDHSLSATHRLPAGTVVLNGPGYDGMQYYQIARDIPRIAQPTQWPALATENPPGSYAYQRFLLPVLGYLLSFGNDAALPSALLIINLCSLFGTLIVVLRWKRANIVNALALTFGPAAMVGLHFSLAEPLMLFLMTACLIRIEEKRSLDVASVVLLSLTVLTREVGIFLCAGLFLWFAWKRQWRDAALLLIPAGVFLALHALIFGIFGEVPFFSSTDKRSFPLLSPVALLRGMWGYSVYTLSAIALLLAFVVPAFCLTVRDAMRRKSMDLPELLLGLFLLLMLCVPQAIWGSITSIGRVITPVYPLFMIVSATKKRPLYTTIEYGLLAIGLVTAIGLAATVHPFTLS